MTDCTKCGHEISKTEVELGFCVNCGERIDSLSIQLDEDYDDPKKRYNYFDFEGEY